MRWLAVFLPLVVGCAPTIQVEMMRAADVTIDPSIQTVAVIDRSGASNFGQGVLGAIEGALTGEAIGADSEGRREAIRGVTETLRAGPRYQVVQPVVSDAEQSLFDRELSWRAAKRICRRAGCDAIVALEAFDSDSRDVVDTRQVERTLANGRKVMATEYSVERRTRVLAAWRMYDPERERVLDELRDHTDTRTWTERGDTREQAVARLPSQRETVRVVAYQAGVFYARRIAPSPVWVTRTWYGRGHPDLKLARDYVKARDWDGAARIWERLADDPDPRVRGKALYNLALYHEVQGRLERAAELARQAAVALANGRSRRYVVAIDQRIRDRDRVQEQLAPPPEPAPPQKVRPERGMSRP